MPSPADAAQAIFRSRYPATWQDFTPERQAAIEAVISRELAVARPIIDREERERLRVELQPLFGAIDSPDGQIPPFQPISDAAQRAFAALRPEADHA